MDIRSCLYCYMGFRASSCDACLEKPIKKMGTIARTKKYKWLPAIKFVLQQVCDGISFFNPRDF